MVRFFFLNFSVNVLFCWLILHVFFSPVITPHGKTLSSQPSSSWTQGERWESDPYKWASPDWGCSPVKFPGCFHFRLPQALKCDSCTFSTFNGDAMANHVTQKPDHVCIMLTDEGITKNHLALLCSGYFQLI